MAITPILQTAPAPSARRTDSLRGIALMAMGMFLFSCVDTMAKVLTETVPPVRIVWFRQSGLLLGVLVLVGHQRASARRRVLSPSQRPIQSRSCLRP